jgi:hypothetical protein
MNRQGFLVGFLAGGWLATVLIVLLPHVGILSAGADEDPGGPNQPFGPGGGPGVGPTVNPSGSAPPGRSVVNPAMGMTDSNRRSIAISASVGSGQSVVYYFDTEAQRLCVYQYTGGPRGGLRLLAARRIEYDLKLEQYRDLSEKTPQEMREAWEAWTEPDGDASRGSQHPTKRVEVPGGIR